MKFLVKVRADQDSDGTFFDAKSFLSENDECEISCIKLLSILRFRVAPSLPASLQFPAAEHSSNPRLQLDL